MDDCLPLNLALMSTSSDADPLRQMIDAAPVLLWVSDAEKRGIYFNQRWLEFTGRPLEAELGEGWLETIHPEDLDAVIGICGGAFCRGEPFDMEFRMRRADGKYRWLLDQGAPRRGPDGALLGYVGCCVDVTDRRNAEKALEEQQQRLEAVLQVLPLPLFIADARGTLQLTNPAADEIWGKAKLSADSAEYADDYQAWWPDSGRRVASHEWGMARAIHHGEEVHAEEMLLVGPDGKQHTILNYARPIRDRDGRINGGVALNVDITQLKAVEGKLRQADQRKNEFLATLAHELRNPLAPIRTGLELMKRRNNDPETMEKLRDTMERQTLHLVALVNDLLDVSRITRGKLELRKRRIELEPVIRLAVEAVRTSIDQAGHTLSIELPESAIVVEADPDRLVQVLTNLLHNAIKYTPAGGTIRLLACCDDTELLIRVRDTGIGIPEEMQEQIFAMFSQVNGPMERSHTGLGIGLTLVRSLVHMHGGRIDLISEGENRGSEFIVRLPISAAGGLPDLPKERLAPARLPESRRVLVVDDNSAAADTLGLMMEALGCETRTARSGAEALDIGGQFLPELILMDLGMPQMDGYECALRIRQLPWGRKAALIALSGWGRDHDRERSQQAGFDHHLVKPAEPEDLRRVLAGLLPLNTTCSA